MARAAPTYTHAAVHGNGDALNPPGGSGKQVPFKVTRTFIDVNGDIDDDDLNVEFGRRQFSEPSPRVGMNGHKNAPRTNFGETNMACVGGGEECYDFGAPSQTVEGGNSMGAEMSPDGMESFGMRAAAAFAAASDAVQPSPLEEIAAMSPAQTPAAPPPEWASTVTVMMRNIPNKYTKRMLITEINHNGFLGTFDFLYLPIDPETAANRGYAFLNFIDPGFAWMFKVAYEGQKMNLFNSHKVVSVTAATLQGFEANYAHYSTSRVNRGDPSARPLFLREPADLPQMPMVQNNPSRLKNRKPNAGPSKLDGLAAQQAAAKTFMQQHAPQEWFPGATMNDYFGMGCKAAVDGMSRVNGGTHFGGFPQEEFVPQPSAPKVTVPFAPKFCPYCGTPTKPEFKFCPNCGGSFDFGGTS